MRPGIKFHEYMKTAKYKEKIVIDHHNTNTDDQELVWVDVNSASTGVMIYKILNSMDIEITKDISTLIYSTIVGDTGSFRYSNTNSESLKIASELVEYGAEPEFVSQAIYENEPLKKINLIARALNTLEIDKTNKIASVYIDNDMFAETGTTREDTEGIINIPRKINGISVAVLLRQENKSDEKIHRWKVSLRSKYEVDVSAIAQKYGGGGHVKASGLTIEGNLSKVKEDLIGTIKEVI
jgi:phosphoesterase RecJ-like protein